MLNEIESNMAFPLEVKEKALLACGRHCCICHKFCGLKIEMHHIKHVSEGGSNSFDNCIPLCLECHADMRSYDYKHPKGIKYTQSELKAHRDNWYEKIKNNLGSGGVDNLTQDINLFKLIMDLLPPAGSIYFIRNFDFAGSFLLNNLIDIDNFISKLKEQPWLEFFDSDLEGLKSELYSKILKLRELIAIKTFNIEGSSEVFRVQEEWKYENSDMFYKAVSDINEAATLVIEIYDNFIRLSRKKLSVEV